jgi:zinc D-Ala-D-Ala carboxypeptidase
MLLSLKKMQLSKNFYLSELIASQTATRLGLPNQPNKEQIQNLKNLCQIILQPTRDHFDRPLIVSSGFRSPSLNARIGSNPDSHHCTGHAADFEIPGISNLEIARWIGKNLLYDQLILEFYQHKDPSSGWVHCSYGGKLRQQNFIFNGKSYEPW